ncbi:MAG: (Fe-S)-binding protein [Verrucomicrobia bacterium]|nr:(Fe-S)-binding protein [Verrucomicrobiota bacterium]
MLKPFIDERTALTCVHCGLCLTSCPTYLETGDENLSPRGRIYLMRQLLSGRVPLNDATVQPLDVCLGCLGCQTVCPGSVHYGELIEHTRDFIEHGYQRSLYQWLLRRVLVEQVFPFPWRTKLALAPLQFIRWLRVEGWLPRFTRGMTSLVPAGFRSEPLPLISPTAATEKKGRIGFVEGCVQSVMFGPTNSAVVRLLTRAGFDVVTPPGQVCCGALYSHSGHLEKARDCARRNIEVFERFDVDHIVIGGSGCGATLKEYGLLLKDDPDWAARGKNFAAKVRDMVEILSPGSFTLKTESMPLVTYHDACHLNHAQGIRQQPRDLLKAVCGSRYVELPESDLCCGSAGSYNLTQPDMAARLQKRKVSNILKTGASVVLTTNPGCMLQIRAGLVAAGRADIEVVHLADFLDRLFCVSRSR